MSSEKSVPRATSSDGNVSNRKKAREIDVGTAYHNEDKKAKIDEISMAGETKNGTSVHTGHFHRVGTSKISCVEVEEYISEKTGVRVFLGDVNSPIVCGYFTLPTEAHDNDGLPHTLEHLIFMGSKEYPYKGVLDILANKCLSQGTNAWTAIDHTTYTVTTAGIEGFLNIFPIYIDHILRPTLESDAFITEVHHITPEGTNSGVVYSEMQSRENTASSILQREMAHYLFPGDSGYKYETGGMLADLRLTNNEKVKAYHKQFYKWSNLNLIITGKYNKNDVLSVIAAVEQKHIDDMTNEQKMKIKKQNDEKPWTEVKNFTKLEKSVVSSVKFPSDDEDSGRVAIGWRGPPWASFMERETIDILGAYLTDSNLSPLQKLLVEIEQPFCSDVDYSVENYKATCFYIECEDVPSSESRCEKREKQEEEGENNNHKQTKMKLNNEEEKINKMDIIGAEVHKIIRKVYDEGIDMKRLNVLLKRERLQYLRGLETSPHDSVVETVNEYCVNGDDFEQLKKSLEMKKIYEELEEKNEQYWKTALKEYFIDTPCVEIRCIPSKEKARELQEAEKNLQKKQQNDLGEEKLKDIKIMLDQIKEKQKEKAPREILECIPFADVNKVQLLNFPITTNFDSFEDGNDNKNNISAVKEGEEETFFLENHKKPNSNSDSNNDAFIPMIQEQAKNEEISETNKSNNNINNNGIYTQLKELPFFFQLNEIPSDFVQMKILARIPDHPLLRHKDYLPLLDELIFECPLAGEKGSSIYFSYNADGIRNNNNNNSNNIYMSHETLTQKLLESTTSYSSSIGMDGSLFRPGIYHDFLCISATCSVDTYIDAVCLLLDNCINMRITDERLQVQVKILKNSISKKKRSAKFILDQIECGIRYKQDCVVNQCSLSKQEEILNSITCNSCNKKEKETNTLATEEGKVNKRKENEIKEQETRDENEREETIKILQYIYDEIFQPNNIIVQISADVNKLPHDWFLPWRTFAKELTKKKNSKNYDNSVCTSNKEKIKDTTPSSSSPSSACLHMQEVKEKPFSVVHKRLRIQQGYDCCIPADDEIRVGNSILCGLASTDASYLSFTVKAGEGFLHEDVPALMVLSEYFSIMEGPLFRNIRGAGYAYGCCLRYIPYTGEINLRICPATDVCGALSVALNDFKKYSYSGGEDREIKTKRKDSITDNNSNTDNHMSLSNMSSFSFSSSFDSSELESAKSSTLFSIINKEETVADYAYQTLLNVFKGVPYNNNRILLNKIQAIDMTELTAVSQKYLSAFCSFRFDACSLKEGKSLCIVANSKKLESISSGILACPAIDNIRTVKPKIFFKCLLQQLHLEEIQTEEEDDYDDEEEEEGEDNDESDDDEEDSECEEEEKDGGADGDN